MKKSNRVLLVKTIIMAIVLIVVAFIMVLLFGSPFKTKAVNENTLIKTPMVESYETEVLVYTTYSKIEHKIEEAEEIEEVEEPEIRIVEPEIDILEEEVKAEEIEEPAEEEPKIEVEEEIEIDPEELELLACVIYQEAGADYCCDDCRRRVADVVLNRVEDDRFPDNIQDVLTQKRQYGRYYWTGVVWPERAKNDCEKHAVERAYRIAEEVLKGEHSELYGEGYIWQAEFKQGTGIVYCDQCKIYFGK